MSIDELELQIRLGKLSLADAMSLAAPATPREKIVVKRNKSGGVFVSHPGVQDRWGFNLTERVADFIVSDAFLAEVAPLIRELPKGCAPAK